MPVLSKIKAKPSKTKAKTSEPKIKPRVSSILVETGAELPPTQQLKGRRIAFA